MQFVLEQHQQLLHGAGHPVGFVDHQRVARLQPGQCLAQLGAGAASAGGFDDDLAAVRVVQGVELELVILGASGHPGVTEPDRVGVRHFRNHPEIHPETPARHPGCGTSFGTV